MRLQVQDLWSPDLDPPSTGEPEDNLDFDIQAQVALGMVDQVGREVFSLRVCSPTALARTEAGTFVTNTLVVEQFSWAALRGRLEKLLAQCNGSRDWDEAIRRLSGCLRHNDAA